MNRYTWRTGVLELVMIVAALIFFFPVYILLITAFKSPGELSSPLLPSLHPTFANFAAAWDEARLGTSLMNSVIVTVVSIAFLVFAAALASYPLGRAAARWSRPVYYSFVLGMMIPFQVGLLPLYIHLRQAGLIGGLSSLLVLYAGFQMPFSVFLYTEFVRSIPKEFDEAASLDGASRWRTFWSVIFPMLGPVTGTAVVLNAVVIWNDFFAPLVYLSGSSNVTLPVAVYSYILASPSKWNLIFASLVLGILPILIAFLLAQRAVFRGFSAGLKG